MSSGRSIDGLQRRRPTKTAAHASNKHIAQASKASTARRVVRKPTTSTAIRRTVGISDVKAAPKRSTIEAPVKKVKDDSNKAIKDFLNESKDLNPTDLVELPEKKSDKSFKREQKRLKKSAKKIQKAQSKKKSHVVRNIFLVLLILILSAGTYAYFTLNDFVGNITDDGNIINLIFADDSVKLEMDENGRTNILIFGTEGYDMNDPNYDGGYLTDSMMVLSLNQETGDSKIISLPRDLYYSTCTATRKMNEVFWCTFSQNDGSDASVKEYENAGGEALEAAFEDVLGLNIQYRVHVNWQAVVQAVDAIGGIDVVFLYDDQTWDGPETVIYTSDPRGLADGYGAQLYYNYPNSEPVHLDGEWALAVARTRNAYGGWGAISGNFSREYFQQRIIQAAVKKVRDNSIDLSTALGIKSAIGDNLRTNFKDTEIKTLIKLANNIDINGLKSLSLYQTTDDGLGQALLTTGSINGISYVYPYSGAGQYYNIHTFIENAVRTEGYLTESASLVVLNATSTYGVASNEKISLEDEGYSVTQIGNTSESFEEFDGVMIYQLTNNAPQTATKLTEYYGGVEIITEIPTEIAEYNDADFVIVIGNGYSKK